MMILQSSVCEQLETLLVLAGTVDFDGLKRFESSSSLKVGYRSFLSSFGQRKILLDAQAPLLVLDETESEELRHCFRRSSLDDRAQAYAISSTQDAKVFKKSDRIAQALHELSLYSKNYSEIFNIVVTDILIFPSETARAGSTSGAIGVIWANPKITYTIPDIIEILVHEFTHNAVFLDELRFEHFLYKGILDKSTWAHSAILKMARPLDKVLHSILVAVEILLFRIEFLGHPVSPRVHPPTKLLVAQLKNAISSTEDVLKSNNTVFFPRAMDLLENAKRILIKKFLPLVADFK